MNLVVPGFLDAFCLAGVDGGVVDDDVGAGVEGEKAVDGAGPAGEEGGGAGPGLRGAGGEAGALVALGGSGDDDGDGVADGVAGRTLAVGQEAFGVGEGDEGAGHGGDDGGDAAGEAVADGEGAAGAFDGVVEEAGAFEGGGADFAGGAGGVDADHGWGAVVGVRACDGDPPPAPSWKEPLHSATRSWSGSTRPSAPVHADKLSC